MTWTWTIEGLGTNEQTLILYNPQGDKIGSATREGWSWKAGKWPEKVADLMPTTIEALMALRRGDIERVQ